MTNYEFWIENQNEEKILAVVVVVIVMYNLCQYNYEVYFQTTDYITLHRIMN